MPWTRGDEMARGQGAEYVWRMVSAGNGKVHVTMTLLEWKDDPTGRSVINRTFPTAAAGYAEIDRIRKRHASRHATRRNPTDPTTISVKVYTRNTDGIRWDSEATCTLQEFFDQNEMPTKERAEIQRALFIRRQYVGGGGAWAEWKIAL